MGDELTTREIRSSPLVNIWKSCRSPKSWLSLFQIFSILI
jgi:hypothetical protein